MFNLSRWFSRPIPRGSALVFDLNHTLVDSVGATARPGVEQLLASLQVDYRLVLWTHSRRWRGRRLLREHNLAHFFDQQLYRQDYDPDDIGTRKDIRRVQGRLIVDDDAEEIAFNARHGARVFHIPRYRQRNQAERVDDLYDRIRAVIAGRG